MNHGSVLIVDNDASVLTSLALLLKQAGFHSHSASSPAEALAVLGAGPVELVIQDMNFFTPFFSTKENGQGIGLTMVQEILTQHRFEFSLESLPGEPTRFLIYMPV